MYRVVVTVRFLVQVAVLHLSWWLHRRRDDHDWVIGPYEVAGIVHELASAVPRSFSVLLAPHPFYAFRYGWTPSARAYPLAGQFRVWLLAPWKLGELARRTKGFVYVSGEGFLHAAYDYRRFEFAFLKRHGLRIACYFTGSDIRSPRLMRELERETGRPNIATYLPEVNPVFGSEDYDHSRRRVADAANRYADAVFNAPADQLSYLTVPQHPFRYFHSDDQVTDDFSRFDDWSRPVVLHVPSSPVIKGTQIVRAAVARLREEGLDFEYIELVRVPHEQVLAALARAHIVLNEFFAFVPGVFGVEAMASGAALLTSAARELEPVLPEGSDEAWIVTPSHRIGDHLRAALADRERTRAQAVAGRDWVRAHAVRSVSGPVVTEVLDRVLA